MKRPRSILFLLLILWVKCPAQQQLTLDRCIEMARAYSLKSRASDLALRTSALSRDELATTRLPQVKFSSDVSYAPNSGTFGYDPAITDGGQIGGRVSIAQSIYDAGVRGLKSGQLDVEHDALSKEKQVTERDIVFTIEQLFIEALRSQREIELQRESMHQLREYLDLVERLARGGSSSYTDVLKTQVQLQSSERSLQKANESYSSTKYALTEFMGGAIDTNFSVVGTLETLLPVRGEDGLPSDMTQNLDIALAELNVNKSRIETEITRRERLPVISAVADAGLLTSFDNLRLPGAERLGVYGYMVGLTLEVPLFTWGATDLRIQQHQLATETLGLQLEGIRRSVATEYQKARHQLAKVGERLRSLRTSLNAAGENFALTKAKYAAGGVLSLEVLSAQQLLTDLKLEELETVAEGQSLSAKLEQITSR
jgi:outer membrane protein TolC